MIKEMNTVQCCRCKNKHKHCERIPKKTKGSDMMTLVCPRCGAHNFYDLDKTKM